MELLTTVLAYGHIVSAIAWLGGGIMFGMVIAPRLGKLALSSSRDFVLTVLPGVLRFFQVIAGVTILFGLLLLYDMHVYDHMQLDFSTSWGFDLILGMSVALVAFLYSELVAIPVFHRIVTLNRKMGPDGSGVPPELPRTVRQAGMASLITLVLLLVTVSFMVAAGFY
jgi:hypothetical protein